MVYHEEQCISTDDDEDDNVLTSLKGLGSGLFPNTGVKSRTKKRSFNWTCRVNTVTI